MIEDLRAWLDATLQTRSPKSDMAGAVRYALSRWTALTRYLDDGEVEIDNNAAERAGDGPDVVIEAIGLAETFRMAVEEVAFTGRVVYIGYAKEPVAYETRLFVQKELDILGSRNALPEDFREVMAMLDAGRFPVDRAITAVVPLAEGPSYLERWSARPAAFTKIMIDLNQ